MFKLNGIFILCISIALLGCGENDITRTVEDSENMSSDNTSNLNDLTCRYPPQEFTIPQDIATLKDSLHVLDNFGLGLLEAQKTGKRICLIFTGLSVPNGARLENYILQKSLLTYSKLKTEYVNVWLYCDDAEAGDKNMKLHYNMTESITLPSIVIVGADGIPGTMLIDYEIILSDLEKTL